jgi:putative protease
MAEILLVDNFINDGDSIEIISEDGKSAGCIISGIKKDNVTVKSAKAGDKIKIFMTQRVVAGSYVNKTLDNKLFQKAAEEYAFTNKKKIPIKGVFIGKINNSPILEIEDHDGNYIKVIGEDSIQPAEKQGVSEAKISEQMNKTKDTPYIFESIDIKIEENSFLSLKTINSLRRDALEQLSYKRTNSYEGRIEEIDIKQGISYFTAKAARDSSSQLELIVGVKSLQAGIRAINAGADSIYIFGDYRYKESLQLIDELSAHCNSSKCSLFYVFPQITRDAETKAITNMLMQATERNKELGLVVSNIGHVKIAERMESAKVRGNFTLNALNSAALDFYHLRGLQSLCVSPELNLTQIKDLKSAAQIELEAVVYGYLPAMITEYCPASAAGGCDICESGCNGNYGIIDERDKLFKVINMGNCRSTILNSDVLCVYDNLSNIIESGISKLRLDFYDEDEEVVFQIVKAYKDKSLNLFDKNDNSAIEAVKKNGFTKGHYFRGID